MVTKLLWLKFCGQTMPERGLSTHKLQLWTAPPPQGHPLVALSHQLSLAAWTSPDLPVQPEVKISEEQINMHFSTPTLFINFLGGSTGSSPEPHRLGTSPHINKFLAREPPDGCEKISTKFIEDKKYVIVLNPCF